MSFDGANLFEYLKIQTLEVSTPYVYFVIRERITEGTRIRGE